MVLAITWWIPGFPFAEGLAVAHPNCRQETNDDASCCVDYLFDALFGGIDRNTDAAATGLVHGPHSDQEIVQMQHGPPRGDSHHVGVLIHFPTFAWSAQDDVLLFGVDKDVLNALQAAEVADLIEDACEMLGEYPGVGHLREDITSEPLRF